MTSEAYAAAKIIIESFHVRPPTGGQLVPLQLWPLQEELLKLMTQDVTRPLYIQLLKSRRAGASKFSAAYIAYRLIEQPGTAAVILSHYQSSARRILAMVHECYQGTRYMEQISSHTKDTLVLENGSSVEAYSSRTRDQVRSHGAQIIHASEVAYWDKASEVFDSLYPLLPKDGPARLIVESTGREGGYFAELWDRNISTQHMRRGKDAALWRAVFFPWYKDPRNVLPSWIRKQWLPLKHDARHEDVERELRGLGVKDEQLAWRRWIIDTEYSGDIFRFAREYPAHPSEAFAAGSESVFGIAPVARLATRIDHFVAEKGDYYNGKFYPREDGAHRYCRLSPSDRGYLIACDPADGTPGGCWTAIVVLTKVDDALVACHSWRGKLGPTATASLLASLGRYYGDAPIVVELPGVGAQVITELRNLGYGNIWYDPRTGSRASPGLYITHSRREELVALLAEHLNNDSLSVIDERIVAEARAYVRDPKGRGTSSYGASSGHDDLICALMAAVGAWALTPQLSGGMRPRYDDDQIPSGWGRVVDRKPKTNEIERLLV